MPEFGFGLGDLVLLFVPILILFVLKRTGVIGFSIWASGLVAIGILCIFAQRVNLPHGVIYEGKSAAVIGFIYIIGGSVYLVEEMRHHRRAAKKNHESR